LHFSRGVDRLGESGKSCPKSRVQDFLGIGRNGLLHPLSDQLSENPSGQVLKGENENISNLKNAGMQLSIAQFAQLQTIPFLLHLCRASERMRS
jgi:hypothetical protein